MNQASPIHQGTPPPESSTRNEGIIPRTELPQTLILTSELIRNGWTPAQIHHLLGEPFFSTPVDAFHSHARALLAELAGEVTVTRGGGFFARQKFNLDGDAIPQRHHHPYAVFVGTTPIGGSGQWLTVVHRENISRGETLLCIPRDGAHLSKVSEVLGSWRGFSIVQLEHEREAEVSAEERARIPSSLTGHHQ